MTDNTTHARRASAIALLVVAAILLLYVGCYLALVVPTRRLADPSMEVVPAYRMGGSTAAHVFGPIHWLDRKVRRGYWTNPDVDFYPLG